MKLILTLFTILIYSCISAQVDFTKAYFPYVYRAEMAIVKGDYTSAVKSYDSAFFNVRKPFSKDYLNAAVAAIKAQQFKAAFRYCDSLIAKGVRKEFFTNFGSFRPLWESEEWSSFIGTFEVKYQKFNSGRDTSLAKVFSYMSNLDQEFRRKPGSYRAYGDTIRKIDSINIVQLQSIIKTHGFPNENMINLSDPSIISFPSYIIFHHYGQSLSLSKKGKYNFLQDFSNAVKRGELDPHRFAFLLSLQGEKSLQLGGWGVSTCLLNGERGKLMGEKYGAEIKANIDKNRPEYGLESLEDYYKKAVFALRDERAKVFAFGIYNHINLFEMESDEQCEKFAAASVILE